MKRKRFSEQQIISVLKDREAGAKTADLCCKHGIGEAALYNWKSSRAASRYWSEAAARTRERARQAEAAGWGPTRPTSVGTTPLGLGCGHRRLSRSGHSSRR
ncbi:MAG: transposase [Proteobacteria bacterium]|nr:transposase [Pseudomonadota bacterium]